MNFALLAIAALAAGQAGIPIDAGQANWDQYPQLNRAPRALPTEPMVGRVETMLRERQCALRGQDARRFDITVPYLALLQPDGSLARVLVADMGCPELETFVGEVVLELARAGDFRPTGEQQPRWYASNINFNLTDGE